jgi:hypothetical protein
LRRLAALLLLAALACALPACRGVLGIDPLELVEGGAPDATAEAAADGTTTQESSTGADADAADAGDATTEVQGGEDAADAHDGADGSAIDSADAAAIDAMDAATEADAASDGGADAPDASDASDASDALDAADALDALSAVIAACQAEGGGCRPCCKSNFMPENGQLTMLAVQGGCICGAGQCSAQCDGSICGPPGGPMPPPTCAMCVDQAMLGPPTPTSQCEQADNECAETSTCAPAILCLRACP